MPEIKTIIYIEPVAKGRPKTAVINGHAIVYTPKKTRQSEQMIQALIRTKLLQFDRFPPGTPLRLEAIFYREKPQSAPKRLKMPVQKPDLDNYEKTLCDALEKYLYDNDSQICTFFVKKRFAQPGTEPRIDLRISEDYFDLDEYEDKDEVKTERMLL